MAVERWLRDARHKRPILPFTFPTIINDDRWTDDKPVVPGRFEAGWVKYKHKKRSMEIEQEEREKEEAMEKKKKQEEEEAEREEGHYEKKRKRDNEEERRGKGKEKEEGEKEKEKEVDAGEAGEEEARAQKKVRIDVEQESFWSVIPPEIVLNYSAYLPLDDIARYSQTCKQIYSMLQDEVCLKFLHYPLCLCPFLVLLPMLVLLIVPPPLISLSHSFAPSHLDILEASLRPKIWTAESNSGSNDSLEDAIQE
ncbi:Unconventional myosin-VI, variant 2 [Balamuthia mandrillaris]